MLDFFRIGMAGQSHAPAEPADVGVHGDARGRKSIAENDIGSLPADAWQVYQLLQVRWHLAAMFLSNQSATSDDVLGLVAKETRRLDGLFQLGWPSVGKRCGVGVAFEKGGRHDIHANVGALRRQYGGDKQLQGVLEVKRTMSVRI